MVKVGYLTIAFCDGISTQEARNLINNLADEALSYQAVDAVKCDIGVLDGGTEAEFWAEAHE